MVMLLSMARTLTAPWPFSICIFGMFNGSIGGTVSSSIPAEDQIVPSQDDVCELSLTSVFEVRLVTLGVAKSQKINRGICVEFRV